MGWGTKSCENRFEAFRPGKKVGDSVNTVPVGKMLVKKVTILLPRPTKILTLNHYIMGAPLTTLSPHK